LWIRWFQTRRTNLYVALLYMTSWPPFLHAPLEMFSVGFIVTHTIAKLSKSLDCFVWRGDAPDCIHKILCNDIMIMWSIKLNVLSKRKLRASTSCNHVSCKYSLCAHVVERNSKCISHPNKMGKCMMIYFVSRVILVQLVKYCTNNAIVKNHIKIHTRSDLHFCWTDKFE
jgi:hypothetical protein